MELTDEGLGIMVIVLGGMLVIAGIVLMVVLLMEGNWWGSILKGVLGMDFPDFGQGSLIPLAQNIIQGLINRIFIYVRISALLGGAGVSVLGAVLIVIGIYIYS